MSEVVKDKNNSVAKIDAAGVYYKQLNDRLRDVICNGTAKIELFNVHGQRYIGTDLNKPVDIEIKGTPGNDLGAFMDGPRITVYGNAQDGCGNTMNDGEITVHGHAGDTVGLSARGGRIYIRDGVGYRAGIHMKEYEDKKPVVVIGGTAQDFFGEYMAGGVLILLGMNLPEGGKHKNRFVGTGMHGGVIYLRGDIEQHQLGQEVGIAELDDNDRAVLKEHVTEFARRTGYEADKILAGRFIKLFPRWLRPYGRLYCY
jgi:glutamate synthase domain-containing protein 3